MKGNVIEVQGLSKSFGALKAVDSIDFQVRHGECFGLLGRNGAGKSTTIKMLIALLPKDAGSVKVNGFDLSEAPLSVRASIGYVPQSLSVDAMLSARQNLNIFGKFYGLDSKTRRARSAEILKILDLEEAADRPVGQYSGGMIRRLEVGQSILHQPPVVFLDEPTTGLDPVARKALWAHIRHLQKELGMSILLTTHYMEEAERLCGRMAIMDRGRIVAMGNMKELRGLARKPRASMDQIFTHFTGRERPEEGNIADVQKSRRITRRLG